MGLARLPPVSEVTMGAATGLRHQGREIRPGCGYRNNAFDGSVPLGDCQRRLLLPHQAARALR